MFGAFLLSIKETFNPLRYNMLMNIDHIGFGVDDYKRSRDFYAKVLAPLGLKVLMEEDTWGFLGKNKCDFWFGKLPGESPKGLHLAFVADNRAQVDEFYKLAIEAGAKDNGKPGLNPEYGNNYYAAFVIDLNGHNLEVVCRK